MRPYWAGLLLLVLLMGCGTESPNDRAGKLRVVSTVGMIADAVHRIGGDRVVSEALMGPGVDPHLYRAKAGDVAKLERADVIFYGGLELEGKMTEIFEKLASRGRMAIPVSERVPKSELREVPGVPGKYDPHLWFDPILWKHAVQAVADGLTRAKPDSKGEFAQRARWPRFPSVSVSL
jgi:manganese/zinc/iron transport system substrate-binding protein